MDGWQWVCKGAERPKAVDDVQETYQDLKWAVSHGGCIKGLWRSPFVPQSCSIFVQGMVPG